MAVFEGIYLVWAAIVVLSIAVVSMMKPPKTQPPTPASLSDFSLPTAEEGRSITVVFGTRLISGANVVWYGNLGRTPIRK